MLGGHINRVKLNRVKSFVQFVGCARSGHTLVAQILNAHKDVVISNEIKVVRKMLAGVSFDDMLQDIYNNSVEFAKTNNWTQYNYSIPGQWQGKTIEPVIIGNKFGPEVLKLKGGVLNTFFGYVKYPVKFIHVSREREAHINSMVNMCGWPVKDVVKRYEAQTEMSKDLIKRYKGITVELGMLKETPDVIIRSLCQFLEIECTEDYLKACIGIIKK